MGSGLGDVNFAGAAAIGCGGDDVLRGGLLIGLLLLLLLLLGWLVCLFRRGRLRPGNLLGLQVRLAV